MLFSINDTAASTTSIDIFISIIG